MAEKDDPKLWESIKNKVLSLETAGTKAHQWSARKAQMAVRLYKEHGGGYIGPKDKNNSLTKWTEQDWRTKSGKPSSLTHERYLPAEAIKKLSPYQYHQTSLKKERDTEAGNQFSKQPETVAKITKKYR